MTLAPRNPQIPGVTKPAICKQPRIVDGKSGGPGKCGLPGNNTIEGVVELFGKEVPVKINMCNKHYEIYKDNNVHWSIGGNNGSQEANENH